MALTCDSCGASVVEGDAFCGECGASVNPQAPESMGEAVEAPEQGGKSCGICGGVLTAGESFCPWCGVQISGPAPPPPPQAVPQPPPPPPPQNPPGYQTPSGAPPAGPSSFSQGTNEVSERVKGTWENPATRLPIVFLAGMVLGFVLLADTTELGILYPLVLGGVVFALLVFHATSPTSGDGPILGAAGIALVFSTLASLFGSFVLIALVASDGASFEFGETRDESITVTLGAILALVGSVGLFLTALRAYILEVVQRR